MPTRNISLTREQDAFIDQVVEAGEYQNASEAMRDALRALQQRRQEDELRLSALRAQIAVGARELAAGDSVVVESGELKAFLRGLTRPASRRRRRPSRPSR